MNGTDKMFITTVCKARKLPTGSILAYDELNNEYFAINSLVKQLKIQFKKIIDRNPSYILFVKEVWTGGKWNNKEVNKIIYISDQKENVIKFSNIIIEKDETLRMIYKNNSRIIELYETDTRNFKKLNETKFNTISDSDKALKNILEIQNSNENTRTELKNNNESLRKRLNEIYSQIEIIQF